MFNKIIYLHGFNSSPASHKARLLLERVSAAGLQEKLLIPELESEPEAAIRQIERLVETQLKISQATRFCFVGSSLGGYYATWFAEKYHCRSVLINPSVRPYESLVEYLGVNENYFTMQKWTFNKSHIQQLSNIDIRTITQPQRYLVLLQTGDEVLDYRIAEKKYSDCQLVVEQGGDHSFQNFENHVGHILSFSGISISSETKMIS